MGAFPSPAHEAVLVCSRGSLPFTVTGEQSVQDWPQPYWKGRKLHSAKPEAFLDLVERASPEPRLEMFARRARLEGWDYWGDQSLNTAEVAA
jgi:N6-adenosine-specific RNA methylase IME4